jgi:hypothetical protein
MPPETISRMRLPENIFRPENIFWFAQLKQFHGVAP